MGLKNQLLLILLTLFTSASVFAKSSKAEKRYFFAFGPGFFTNLNSKGLSSDINPGINWTLSESIDLIVATDIGFSFKHSDVLYFSPQLKGRYYFSPEESGSYFLGAGLGYGYAKSHGRSQASKGFSIGGSYGYKAYRDQSMQIDLYVEHQIITDESGAGTPIMTFFKVGVYFKSL